MAAETLYREKRLSVSSIAGKLHISKSTLYREDQLSALGLVVNIIVLWNTIYMNAILDRLRMEGYEVKPEDEARLSPFGHDHINMLGRYSFAIPDAVVRGELRPLRAANES